MVQYSTTQLLQSYSTAFTVVYKRLTPTQHIINRECIESGDYNSGYVVQVCSD